MGTSLVFTDYLVTIGPGVSQALHLWYGSVSEFCHGSLSPTFSNTDNAYDRRDRSYDYGPGLRQALTCYTSVFQNFIMCPLV